MGYTYIEPYLSDKALESNFKNAGDQKIKDRWHLLWLVQSKKIPATKASEYLGRNKSYGCYWIKQYNKEGPKTITEKKITNPNLGDPKINPKIKTELFKAFIEPVPERIGGGLWSGPKVKLYIHEFYNIEITRVTGWGLLKKAGLSVQRVRPRHKSTSDEKRNEFKKNST
jgi:transposase